MTGSTGNMQNIHERTQDGGFEFDPTTSEGDEQVHTFSTMGDPL